MKMFDCNIGLHVVNLRSCSGAPAQSSHPKIPVECNYFAKFTSFCLEAYLEHCVFSSSFYTSNISNHLSLWLFVSPKSTWLNLKIERLMKITCLKLQRAPRDTGLAMTIAWMASAKAFQVSVELMGTASRFHRFHAGAHLTCGQKSGVQLWIAMFAGFFAGGGKGVLFAEEIPRGVDDYQEIPNAQVLPEIGFALWMRLDG